MVTIFLPRESITFDALNDACINTETTTIIVVVVVAVTVVAVVVVIVYVDRYVEALPIT